MKEAPVEPPKEVLVTIPVTIGDKMLDLVMYKGVNAEESVAAFCKENVPEDHVACIRQLLPIAIEKIESLPTDASN